VVSKNGGFENEYDKNDEDRPLDETENKPEAVIELVEPDLVQELLRSPSRSFTTSRPR
jgi:hypothetical protein